MKRNSIALILSILITIVFSECFVLAADNSGYIWPTSTTTLVKNRGFKSNHQGIDIAVVSGTKVYASKSGTITAVYYGCKNVDGLKTGICKNKNICKPNTGFSTNEKTKGMCNNGFGNGFIIKHSDGTTQYAHLSEIEGNLEVRMSVSQGTLLGKSGSSGNSTGAHLHFAMTNANKTYINPLGRLNGGESTETVAVTTTTAQSITETNATIYGRVDKSSSTKIDSVGVYFGKSEAEVLGSKPAAYETVNSAANNNNGGASFEMWYDVNKNIKKLEPGTTYYWQCYAKVGATEYKGAVKSFTTKGSVSVTAPVAPSVTAEATSDGKLSVSLSCSTSGVTMYWTSNGSAPTTSSSVYSGKQSFPGSRTIKAIAVKDGKASSVTSKTLYVVRLDANGGSLDGSAYKCYEAGAAYGSLPTPKQSGYTFAGWYTSKTGGTVVSSLKVSNDNAVYAQWQSQSSGSEPSKAAPRYRTRQLETTESDKFTLSGWEFKEVGKLEKGSWSNWGTSKISPNSTLEIETRTTQEPTTKTVYNYYHYTYTKGGQQWTTYSKNPGSGITTKYATKQLDSQLPKLTLSDNTYTAYGTRAEWWYRVDNGCPSSPGGSFETKVTTGSKTITEYRSRPMTQYYIHTRWGNWSDWKTGTPPAASSTLQVEVEK